VDDGLRTSVATRLSRYLQVASRAGREGAERISSHEIAASTGINATQVRRDLSSFGRFGKRGSGYQIELLCWRIRFILGVSSSESVVVIGAGRVGEALLSSNLFDEQGIEVVGIFDADSAKVGKRVGSLTVSPLEELKGHVERHGTRGAVIAVPAEAAQAVADELVGAGVRVLLSYSEASLEVPGGVVVRTLNPAVELLSRLRLND
jgi:redox-sensing transcriptional repressor